MFRIILFLIALLLATSCATLINTDYCTVKVNATTAPVQITVPQTNQEYNTPAVIALKRSRDDIVLIARNDSLEKEIVLESKLSPAFTVGNLFGAGIYGYAIDLTNKRRFTYQRNVTVDLYASENTKYPLFTDSRPGINFTITIPAINSMYISNGSEHIRAVGFYGFGVGMEFYQQPHEFLSIETGIASHRFVSPILTDGTEIYPYNSRSAYFNVRQNFNYRNWQFGAGIGVSNIRMQYRNNGIDTEPETDVSRAGYGLSLAGGYKISKKMFLQLLYQPIFINYKGAGYFDYQHTVSVQFTWKLKLKNYSELN